MRDRDDLDDDSLIFRPTYAHQIFGENENIFGYKDLRVRLYYTAGSLAIYLNHKYAQRVDDFSSDGMQADDVHGKIAELITTGCYYTNIDEFAARVDKEEDFLPLGAKIEEYHTRDEHGDEHTFEFYMCNVADTPAFVPFHARLQTFMLWFVDAASYIDIDDPQWSFCMCYERYTNSAGKTMYSTVGYTTVYMYYAYPDQIRPRISQMLVLPPYQRLGVGSKMLAVLYAQFRSDARVRDVTVEDPSDDFRRIRNVLDATLCSELAAFAPELLHAGFSESMVTEAREQLKINKKQCRVVYEILRLAATDETDEKVYKAYRLAIKNRLNQSFYRQQRYAEKQLRADPQFLATLPTVEERIVQLRGEYAEVEDEYRQILKKLDV